MWSGHGVLVLLVGLLPVIASQLPHGAHNTAQYGFNDVHFHLTNYIQEGPALREFLKIMGTAAGRSTLFGIPQPAYYLATDAPLYYSFTDADIAMTYLSLPKAERARFDPMITGFNPADMYAADHIRRVLRTFPDVFSGIGEFTLHKEFVSSKVAGSVSSLSAPAVDRILDLAEEAGLVVLVHNDVDVPFAEPDSPPAYLDKMESLLKRHPNTTIIWAHMGVGRVVRPVEKHMQIVEKILSDPSMRHVMFDISWDEVAKYAVQTPDSLKIFADVLNRYPDRILFGTDSLAPKTSRDYLHTYEVYGPLWPLLTREASLKVRKTNYERVFDQASRRVRAWEAGQSAERAVVSPAAR